jgi:hypothetical protein
MVEGTVVNIGGKDLIIPRMNFKAQRKLGDHLGVVTTVVGMPTGAQMESIFEVICAAIQRNYPEIGRDWIEENVEFDDLEPIVSACMKPKRSRPSPNVESP